MFKILNSKGEEITLNEREQLIANYNQQKANALGMEINITTLTTILKSIIEQKFFEVAPADYLPVKVGEGAWSTVLTTYQSFMLGGDFEDGLIKMGAGNARLAEADAGVEAVSLKVHNWAKSIGWTLPELETAAKAGNWDLVTGREKSRKKNWDLGIQKVAFLGLASGAAKGLLNLAGVTINTTLIAEKISAMDPTELSTFCQNVLEAYRSNCARTAWPSHFIIPESDYLGLAAPSSPDFPLKSKMALLLETFQIMTKNPNFKILPLAYADAAYNADVGLNKTRYVLLNYNEDSLRMNIPVDYTNTLANSLDNFSFQNVGYGQFTGVQAYRPLEMLYIDLTPA